MREGTIRVAGDSPQEHAAPRHRPRLGRELQLTWAAVWPGEQDGRRRSWGDPKALSGAPGSEQKAQVKVTRDQDA